jgi:DNA polymerase alpha subunit A
VFGAHTLTALLRCRGVGEKIKASVNKIHRLLEIEMDGIYRTMLLLKKKKYAVSDL